MAISANPMLKPDEYLNIEVTVLMSGVGLVPRRQLAKCPKALFWDPDASGFGVLEV